MTSMTQAWSSVRIKERELAFLLSVGLAQGWCFLYLWILLLHMMAEFHPVIYQVITWSDGPRSFHAYGSSLVIVTHSRGELS